MLRPGLPGGVVSGGDIDNRLKTLFDALQVPKPDQIPSNWTPGSDEKPLYWLLEDDRLITRFNVEVAQLLFEPPADTSNYCELIIRVRVHAINPTHGSQSILS